MHRLEGNWQATAQGVSETKVDSKWMIPLSFLSKHDGRLIPSILSARRVPGKDGERLILLISKYQQEKLGMIKDMGTKRVFLRNYGEIRQLYHIETYQDTMWYEGEEQCGDGTQTPDDDQEVEVTLIDANWFLDTVLSVPPAKRPVLHDSEDEVTSSEATEASEDETVAAM